MDFGPVIEIAGALVVAVAGIWVTAWLAKRKDREARAANRKAIENTMSPLTRELKRVLNEHDRLRARGLTEPFALHDLWDDLHPLFEQTMEKFVRLDVLFHQLGPEGHVAYLEAKASMDALNNSLGELNNMRRGRHRADPDAFLRQLTNVVIRMEQETPKLEAALGLSSR